MKSASAFRARDRPGFHPCGRYHPCDNFRHARRRGGAGYAGRIDVLVARPAGAHSVGRGDGVARDCSGAWRFCRLGAGRNLPRRKRPGGKAAILTVWGGVIVALIDNLLYPILVGKKLRLHTVPVFFAIVGGLAVFGAAGVILGPVILALTDAILEIWRRRTAQGRPAEAGATSPAHNDERNAGARVSSRDKTALGHALALAPARGIGDQLGGAGDVELLPNV